MMPLKSTWSFASDDENSRQSFLSDYDSEFDLSPSSQYSPEKYSISALNKLSINRNEPSPITRSKVKAGEKQIISTPLVSKEELLNNQMSTSSIDGVNKLTNYFKSCNLDENKFSKNCLWLNREIRPTISSSLNSTFNSNIFSLSQTSTIQNNLWTEKLYSTSSNLFNSPNKNQSSILSSSSPLQIVPSSSPSTLKQQHVITNSEVFINKENLILQQFSSKIFFTLIIFIIGLMFGYLLTNTFPSNLIYHWFLILEKISLEINIKYFHLFYDYFIKLFSLV